MADIQAGYWPCKVIDGFYGDNDKGLPVVRINVEITEGEFKGTRHTYEEVVDNKQAPYISRTCKAVGWRCQSLSALRVDVSAWIEKTGGESTVEIKHIEVKKGKRFDKWVDGGRVGPAPIWVKAGSIGRGPKPLRESSKENINDADSFMRAALAADGYAGQGGPPDDAPPPNDDDIPFITCSMAADRASQMPKVLR